MEVDNEYIYVDLLDTAGEVCRKLYTKTISRKLSLNSISRVYYYSDSEYTKVSNRIEANY